MIDNQLRLLKKVQFYFNTQIASNKKCVLYDKHKTNKVIFYMTYAFDLDTDDETVNHNSN